MRTVHVLALCFSLCALPAFAQTDTPIVTVGGQAITHSDYTNALELAAGRTVLSKLVFGLLVRQEAVKEGVLPTAEDVQARIANLSKRVPQIAAQAQDPVLGKGFQDDITVDIALENLRIKDVPASEGEIAAFYEANKAAFAIPGQVQSILVVSETQENATSAEQLLKDGATPETIAKQPGLRVAGVNGFNVNMATLPAADSANIGKIVMAMQPNDIKTIPVQKYFLTFKIKSAQATQTPPLSQVHDDVARQVKLTKAISPEAELAKLYKDNPPVFTDPKYQAYFIQSSPK